MRPLALLLALLLAGDALAAFPLAPPADHPWTRQAIRYAATAPYGSNGQWQHLAYLATGDAAHAREAIETLKRFPLAPGSRNDTREDTIEFALLFRWLKPHMTAAEREQFEGKLHYWAMLILGHAEPGFGTRLDDSDEVTGHYFGLRCIDAAMGTDYCGMLAADGHADARQMREAIRGFVGKAKGGEWIENGQKYNLGTLRLLLVGVAALGPDEFPEVKAWLPELATQLVWIHTPDGRDVAQWGDIEDPHQPELYRFVAVAALVCGLGGDRTGELANLLAVQIAGKEPANYGYRLNSALYAFDPRTLPTAPVRPNPQGLRTTGVGLVLYRRENTMVQLFMPNVIGVDHEQFAQGLRVYDNGEWIVDQPLGYVAGPSNQTLAFGYGAMSGDRRLVDARETADGFTATWQSGGVFRDPRKYWSPPVFVRSMETMVTYRHASRTIEIVDRFDGGPPPELRLIQNGGMFYQNEIDVIAAAPAPWQRIQHCPSEPTATADGYTWRTKGGRAMRLTTDAKRAAEKVQPGVNVGGWYHEPEADGWLMRLTADTLPAATIKTTIGLAVEVKPPPIDPPPPVDEPRVSLPSRVELRRFPDRIERVEVFPLLP